MTLTGITPEQMKQVQRYVTEDVGIDLTVLVENAGLAVAEQARQMLGSTEHRSAVVLVGAGQTGAVGAIAARRVANWGTAVTILLATKRSRAKALTLRALELAETFGVKIFDPGALVPPAELLVDGLVGLGGHGRLRDEYAELAATALAIKVPVLAIDLPSGLDPMTGKADQPAIRADVTLALGYPCAGVIKPFSANLVGRLVLADLGIPPGAWQRFGVPAPTIAQGLLTALER